MGMWGEQLVRMKESSGGIVPAASFEELQLQVGREA
jgi:hypothetical protein